MKLKIIILYTALASLMIPVAHVAEAMTARN